MKHAKNTCSIYLIINLSLLSSGNQGKGCSCPATVSWEKSHQWVSLGCSVRDGQRPKISSYTSYFCIFIIKCLRKHLLFLKSYLFFHFVVTSNQYKFS